MIVYGGWHSIGDVLWLPVRFLSRARSVNKANDACGNEPNFRSMIQIQGRSPYFTFPLFYFILFCVCAIH